MPETLAFAGAATLLGQDDIAAVAGELGIEPALVHAVREVEAAGSGFLPDKRPKILFEAHAFWQQTKGRFGPSNVSASSWDRSLYGPGGGHQYDRLAIAIGLCLNAGLGRAAALESASWGGFQIMGSNFKAAGFADVEHMVAGMVQSERGQLEAFAGFCRHEGLVDSLRHQDWSGFARRYNGPGQVEHYAAAIAGAYAKWQRRPDPVPAAVSVSSHPVEWHGDLPPALPHPLRLGDTEPLVLLLQRRLAQLGQDVAQDGVFGPRTRDAVIAFQQAHGITPADGRVDPGGPTIKALAA